jgi:branched-chain amino acid transport system substrate-binding protein
VGEAGAGVSISQVVPSPTSPIPVVRECAKAMEAAGSKVPMNTTHLEACMGAKILAEGIRRAKKPVSAKSVLDALNNLGTYDLGGFSITFEDGAHHGSKFVELARVTKDGRLLTR